MSHRYNHENVVEKRWDLDLQQVMIRGPSTKTKSDPRTLALLTLHIPRRHSQRSRMKLIGSIAIVLVALASSTDAFAVTPRSLSTGSTTFSQVPSRAQQMTLQASVNHEDHKLISFGGSSLRSLGAMFLSVFLMWNTAGAIPPANANESKMVGQLKGSGLVFKDTLNIERFDDPKVKGVTLYISNFDRPITEKLGGNFFNDPSSTSVACAKTGPVAIADNIAKGTGGEEVFKESRSIMFKDLRVQRIYDEEKKAVIYVSFNTRLDKSDDSNKSRFKSSLCAVALEDTLAASAPAVSAPAASAPDVAVP